MVGNAFLSNTGHCQCYEAKRISILRIENVWTRLEKTQFFLRCMSRVEICTPKSRTKIRKRRPSPHCMNFITLLGFRVDHGMLQLVFQKVM